MFKYLDISLTPLIPSANNCLDTNWWIGQKIYLVSPITIFVKKFMEKT